PSTGLHFAGTIFGSGPFAATIGQDGDIPVPGDYGFFTSDITTSDEGDGRTDFAIWRPTSGLWYAANSNNLSQALALTIGQNGDVPVPGDYDGDGISDPAIFRPSNGLWYAIPSNAGAGYGGTPVIGGVGQAGDTPVPADYNGDGKTHFAIWRH